MVERSNQKTIPSISLPAYQTPKARESTPDTPTPFEQRLRFIRKFGYTKTTTYTPGEEYSGRVPWFRRPVVVVDKGDHKGDTGTVEDVNIDPTTTSGLKVLVRFDRLRAAEGKLDKWLCYSRLRDPE